MSAEKLDIQVVMEWMTQEYEKVKAQEAGCMVAEELEVVETGEESWRRILVESLPMADAMESGCMVVRGGVEVVG